MSKQTTSLPECFLQVFVFSQNHAWNLGVQIIYKCGLYTAFYSIWLEVVVCDLNQSINDLQYDKAKVW